MHYLRVMEQIFNRPMLATPELMHAAVLFAQARLGLVVQAPDPAVAVQMGAARAASSEDAGSEERAAAGVAQIRVHGPLVSRTGNLQLCQTMTAYESIDAAIAQALADPSVTRILLDIDTNGGSATGAFETAARIRAANAQKPVTAVVHFSAFSGGYLLAAAAGEISVSQSSGVGSIGVIAKHVDFSQMNTSMGVSITSIYRGERKNDLSPDAPLTDDARAFLQANVARVYDQFTASVAAMRNLSVQTVVGTQAGLYFGQQALDAGLADRLETPQQALDRLAAAAAQDRASRAGGQTQVPGANTRLRMIAQATQIATRI